MAFADIPSPRTDDRGVAVIEGVDPGRYRVRARLGVRESDPGQVVVEPGSRAQVVLEMSEGR